MSLLPEKFYLDDLFDDFAPITRFPRMPRGEMKCDIYEKGGNVHIDMDVPGYKKEDIKIDVEDGILTIEASMSEDKDESDEEKNYIRKERISGSFRRQFNVGDIDENEINAKFNNGVLKISFPKEEEKKQSKKFIEIK